MYNFAIVALLGLAAYKTVDVLLGVLGIELSAAFKAFLILAAGVLTTEILDYSVFAGWGVTLRDTWMGPVFTGLVVGAMPSVWHAVFGFVGARSHGDAAESRTARAA